MTTEAGSQDLSGESALEAIAAAAAEDAGLGDADLLGEYLQVLLDAVASGNGLSRRNLASFRDAGRRAAARGIALRPLLDLFLSAAWRLWPHLPPVAEASTDPPAVVRAGELMLRAADEVVGALAEGYQLARRQLVAAQAGARREFVDDLLLGGTQGLAGLVERAASFGLTLAGPHAVVVVEAEQPFTDSSPLTAMLERSILGSKADADALVTTKEGSLVVIFAAPDRSAVDQVVSGLTGSLPAASAGNGVQLRRTAQVGSWRIGVGRPHQGPGGVRLSYEQAREALRLGGRLGGSRPGVRRGRFHGAARAGPRRGSDARARGRGAHPADRGEGGRRAAPANPGGLLRCGRQRIPRRPDHCISPSGPSPIGWNGSPS